LAFAYCFSIPGGRHLKVQEIDWILVKIIY